MSGKDHTYTAIFTPSRITLTVIWENWNGSQLQSKTYYKGDSEPSYSGSTPTRPNDSTYRYTFSGWYLLSSSTYSKTYRAQYTSSPLIYTWKKYTTEIVSYTESINNNVTFYPNSVSGTETGRIKYSSSREIVYTKYADGNPGYYYDMRSHQAKDLSYDGENMSGYGYMSGNWSTSYDRVLYLGGTAQFIDSSQGWKIVGSTQYILRDTYGAGTYQGSVTSSDPNAYPANGKHTDGYWYIKQ